MFRVYLSEQTFCTSEHVLNLLTDGRTRSSQRFEAGRRGASVTRVCCSIGRNRATARSACAHCPPLKYSVAGNRASSVLCFRRGPSSERQPDVRGPRRRISVTMPIDCM